MSYFDKLKLTPRQRKAIEHHRAPPYVDAKSFLAHPDCIKVERKGLVRWKSILDVRQVSQGWSWAASVSRYLGAGKSRPLARWNATWVEEAKKRTQDLLEGVGGEEIPLQDLLGGLEEEQLTALYVWKRFTDEEEAAIGELLAKE